eukprot:m.33646 g.33646  ORF g.33646 m.33646 type:complete len:134 (-) comp6462_c1_seq1:175-576(-)
MATQFEGKYRGGIVHASLCLLCIPPHTSSNVGVAVRAPEIPWCLETDDDDPLVNFPRTFTQRMCSVVFVQIRRLLRIKIWGIIFVLPFSFTHCSLFHTQINKEKKRSLPVPMQTLVINQLKLDGSSTKRCKKK